MVLGGSVDFQVGMNLNFDSPTNPAMTMSETYLAPPCMKKKNTAYGTFGSMNAMFMAGPFMNPVNTI